MKKLLSLMLAILMVIAVAVTAIPTTIFAAGNTTQGAADANFKIGDQYYSTLKAALDDAKNGDTIDMLKNVDDDTTVQLGIYSKNLTINGNGHTYTAKKNTNTYLFLVSGGKTVTINNMNMIVQSGLSISEDGGVINLNDCNILSTHRMAIRSNGAKYAEFNLYNTVLEINSDTNANGAQAEPLVYLDGSDYNILNLTGTSKLIRSTKTTDNTGNCSVINIVSAAGYTEVNVGAQAEIVLNQATGDSYSPHGIYNGGQGLVVVNLEKGATVKVDSAINATPYFFYGTRSVGFAINDEGANFLVKSGKTPGTYLSDFTVWEKLSTSPVNGYTAFKPIAPVASGTAAKAAIEAGNVIRYYDGDVKYTDNIKTATDSAADGSVIHVLGNFTQKSENALANVTKKVSFSGYGHTMYFNNNNDIATYPLTFSANSAVANFELIHATTGVISVKEGTVALTNVNIRPGNRVALKFTGDKDPVTKIIQVANIMIKDSVIETAENAPVTEAPIIIEKNGTATFRLREGAIIRRNNPTQGNVDTQAAVLYSGEAVTGSYTINMEAGSMITTNAAAGNEKGSVLAFDSNAGATFTVNVADGAYIASDSENITDLTFVYTNPGSTVNINAHDGAFIVNSSIENLTIQDYNTRDAGPVPFIDAEAELDGYRHYSIYGMEEEFFVYLKDGEEIPVSYYTTFNLPDGATVKLTADRTVPKNGKTVSGNLTIDLNGHTLEDGTNGVDDYLVSKITGTLTVKNGTWNVKRGFVVQESGVLNLDGVTGIATERPYIKLNSGTATANINDSDITHIANGENVILIENETVGTLNITGNSILAHKGGSVGQANSAVVQLIETATATITVGEGVTLSSAYQIEDTAWGGVIVNSGTNTTTDSEVILEAGSKLAIERVDGAGGEAYFVRDRSTGKTIVTDKGATYTVNNAILNDGFYLPKITPVDGETLIGFTATNGEIYKEGKNQITTDADSISFTATSYTNADFDMLNGAAIRTKKGRGIRFSTSVSNELLDKLNGNATFGTLIAHNEKLTESGKSFTLEALGNDSSIAVKIGSSTNKWQTSGDNKVFRAALVGFPNTAKAFTTQFAARAYMTVTYANGETATFYTDFDPDDNIRSMYDVASNLKKNSNLEGDSKEIVEYILNIVDNNREG